MFLTKTDAKELNAIISELEALSERLETLTSEYEEKFEDKSDKWKEGDSDNGQEAESDVEALLTAADDPAERFLKMAKLNVTNEYKYRSKAGFWHVWQLSKGFGIYNQNGVRMAFVDGLHARNLNMAIVIADAFDNHWQF